MCSLRLWWQILLKEKKRLKRQTVLPGGPVAPLCPLIPFPGDPLSPFSPGKPVQNREKQEKNPWFNHFATWIMCRLHMVMWLCCYSCHVGLALQSTVSVTMTLIFSLLTSCILFLCLLICSTTKPKKDQVPLSPWFPGKPGLPGKPVRPGCPGSPRDPWVPAGPGGPGGPGLLLRYPEGIWLSIMSILLIWPAKQNQNQLHLDEVHI